jgi:hypothetical protein
MRTSVKYLLGAFIYIGFALFIYGIFEACRISWPINKPPYEIENILSTTTTSISALFATNLGAVLGFSIAKPNSTFTKLKTWNPITALLDPEPTNLQIIACYIYTLSLFVCGIVWAHRGFEEDPKLIVSIVPEMAKYLIGVIIGAVALGLNIKPEEENLR